jgi:murein DD-endopeptidase MepM/ murein hydrolase activator NlpD
MNLQQQAIQGAQSRVSGPAVTSPAITQAAVTSPAITQAAQNVQGITPPPGFNVADQALQQSQQSQTSTKTVDYNQLKKQGYSPTQIEGYLSSNPGTTLKNAPTNWDAGIVQNTIIPKAAPITERFGQNQPGVEVFSHGFTSGTGIGVKTGTPLATPPGKWKVVESYDQAPQKGYIGNGAGQGWGNNVVIQNEQTGESLRYSHLSDVHVAQGDEINGSRVIGLSGQSGNTTGDHLNLEYIDPKGQPGDVLQSQYAKYLPVTE